MSVATSALFQFRIHLCQISPLVWRRLLVHSETTLAELHDLLQIAFAWTDVHLHRFRIHGRDYALPRGGMTLDTHDAGTARLADFTLRPRERFLYLYDFSDRWEHEVRLEQVLPPESERDCPRCIGGARGAPPKDCGGPLRFQQRRRKAPWRAEELLEQLAVCVRERDETALMDYREEIPLIQEWLLLDRFDRREVNRRLRLYAAGQEGWQWAE